MGQKRTKDEGQNPFGPEFSLFVIEVKRETKLKNEFKNLNIVFSVELFLFSSLTSFKLVATNSHVSNFLFFLIILFPRYLFLKIPMQLGTLPFISRPTYLYLPALRPSPPSSCRCAGSCCRLDDLPRTAATASPAYCRRRAHLRTAAAAPTCVLPPPRPPAYCRRRDTPAARLPHERVHPVRLPCSLASATTRAHPASATTRAHPASATTRAHPASATTRAHSASSPTRARTLRLP